MSYILGTCGWSLLLSVTMLEYTLECVWILEFNRVSYFFVIATSYAYTLGLVGVNSIAVKYTSNYNTLVLMIIHPVESKRFSENLWSKEKYF